MLPSQLRKTIIMKPIEMNGDCKFLEDLEGKKSIGAINPALWNLITSIRDLKLYTNGIKPHRRWKITPVKKYFGMNGTPKVFLEKLETLNQIIKDG